MKRREITSILNTLNSVSELKGVKFAFTVLKNRKKIEAQIEEDRTIFEEILKPSDGFKQYEEERISLCVLHSEKDENGNPIIENEQYKIIDLDKFNSELNNISEKFKNEIEERQKQVQEYQKIMEEDIELNFSKVSFEELPEDVSEKQLRELEFMLVID